MVNYQVQFKPINSVNNKVITNESIFSGLDSTTINADYDVVLMYTRTSWPTNQVELSQKAGYVPAASLKKVDYSVWCIYSVVESVKEAMATAKPLIQEYGVDNVQICKVVPTSTQIVFEEA